MRFEYATYHRNSAQIEHNFGEFLDDDALPLLNTHKIDGSTNSEMSQKYFILISFCG